MIQQGEQLDRHVIPRWNGLATVRNTGELYPVFENSKELPIHGNDLEVLLHEWQSEKSLPLAFEIVSADEMNGRKNSYEQICYIKKEIDNNDKLPLVVKTFFDSNKNGFINETDDVNHFYNEIKTIKKKILVYNRNPLLWSELARCYLILGQEKKAENALKVAYGLAPNNRVILRAASRYYLQMNSPDKALFLLRRSPLLLKDPWLLSSEIAISNSIEKTSSNIKKAQMMIENPKYAPISISELASELGTMDYRNGQAKRGKKKFKKAINQPVENAVAQITWSHNHVHKVGDLIESIPDNINYNYESKIELARTSEDWDETYQLAEKWLKYQPFASIPAMMCSYYYTDFIGDNEKAKSILAPSIKSNPNNIGLINNYAYALLLDNDVFAAETELMKANKMSKAETNIPLIATNGMYCFRTGDSQKGELLYFKAIELAKKVNDDEITFHALLCLAREELLIGNRINALVKEIESLKYNRFYDKYRIVIENYGLTPYLEI